MNRDSIDDIGKPFEPATPGEFFQRGEEAFHIWWTGLDPRRSSGRLELEYESARAVWSATYEHNADCIMLVYDGAESLAATPHMPGEVELGCVVDRCHNGSITLPNREFINWVAKHEDHTRREYDEDAHDEDADTITIWIDHEEQTRASDGPLWRTPPNTYENLRTSADKEFVKWWNRLTPPGALAFRNLDRNEAQVVWCEAFAKLWEDLEVVHDSAHAFAEVASETASLELAFIVDRFHNGKLGFAVQDMLKYWNQDAYVLKRHRTDEVISLRILHVKQDGGS